MDGVARVHIRFVGEKADAQAAAGAARRRNVGARRLERGRQHGEDREDYQESEPQGARAGMGECRPAFD
jgi:hypothetical protein